MTILGEKKKNNKQTCRYTSSSQPNYTALGCFALFSKENILTFEVVQLSETLVGERVADVSVGNTEVQ